MYREYAKNVYEIEILGLSEKELAKLSGDRSLGLSGSEMALIQEHFKKEGRNPTDMELEAFAQSWSEHCCYKSSKNILKKTVFKVKSSDSISAIAEDAAVMEFDEDHAYVMGLESHNHPSALDPYGGSATGVGGILRDVVCMGAQPIALIDPLFFGPLDYPEDKIPQGTKHPQYLFHGVISGIADYGNRVGVPTVAGMVNFHEGYVGNCLVNVGCVGMLPKKELIHSRVGGPGDILILAGGKTGRDGIHGVTFASAELDAASESESRPAVQLGYAIMKEPLMHACLEANRKKLLTGLKDFGGGGLSCVSAEMAHAGGCGATIHIEKIPLKEPGLSPWEIWVSESQERMMLSVRPEKVDEVLELFDFWDVPAVVVGEVDDSLRIKAQYGGKTVLDLEMDFLLEGVRYDRPQNPVEVKEALAEFKMPDLEKTSLEILNLQNVGSREWIIRRYDHQVRANTVLSPMQGKLFMQSHGDAAVLKPLRDSYRGIAITSDVNPWHCRHNPYWGGASCVDETVRNLVSVGSRPHSMADCLNFGNPEKPDVLGVFAQVCGGLHYMSEGLQVPFVSGNVSLYNESHAGAIPPTPTLLGIGIIDDVRKAVSTDLKSSGNLLLVVGDTKRELGASAYYRHMGVGKGLCPKPDAANTKKMIEAMLRAMDAGIVKSCHDISDGGLLAALAEMALGGDLGIQADLTALGSLRTDHKLFSESATRWIVEVESKNLAQAKEMLGAAHIGSVSKNRELDITDGENKLNLSLEEARKSWKKAVQEE